MNYSSEATAGPPPAPERTPVNAPLVLNEEEMAIMRECNKESFWLRSMPLSAVLGGTVGMGIQRGRISPSVRGGPWPKITAAVVMGYLLGKFSYQEACINKFLRQAPHSPTAQRIRESRGLPNTTANSLELIHRDRMDSERQGQFQPPPPAAAPYDRDEASPEDGSHTSGGSWDELRQRHREREVKKQFRAHGLAPPPPGPTGGDMGGPSSSPTGSGYVEAPPLQIPRRPQRDPNVRVNQYGDEVYDG